MVFVRCTGDVDASSNTHTQKPQQDTHYTTNDVLVDTCRSAKTSTKFLYFLITIHYISSNNGEVSLRNHQLNNVWLSCA